MKLCIAIPYYGAAHALFFRCIQDISRQPPCPLTLIDVIGDSLIPRGRNTLAWRFLQTDCDAVLFIDSDIVFSPGHVSRILSHDLAKHPCVGGIYPKKKVEPSWVLNTFPEGPNQPPEADGLLPVQYAGTGFMLITRKVMEEIAAKWPHRRYAADSDEDGDERYDYFPIGPRNIILPELPDLDIGAERYLSEDWAFCELVRALGYDVVVDTEVRLEHMGQVNYPIKAEEALPKQTVNDIRIGQLTQKFLTNVSIFASNGNPETGEPARRLIDVDQMVSRITPPPTQPAAASSQVVPPPLATTTNSSAA